jgi:homoserine kinase
VISGAGPSVIAFSTQDIDLDRWRRPGFEVADTAVCTRGAHFPVL